MFNDENKPSWTFVEYASFSGEGVITKWLRKLKQYDDHAKLDMITTLDILSAVESEKSWAYPEYRKMTNNWADIGEIRFSNRNKVQLRIFGVFDTEARKFVMLAGAIEDNKKLTPFETRTTAIDRNKEVKNGTAVLVEFKYDDDKS